jgi:hypothetical protein
MSRKRISQVCMATARDGRRCGRYTKNGAPMCSAHDPARKAVGIVSQQATDDLPTLLRRLTKDSDPAIRLRAITSLLDRQNAGCPVCKAGETRAAKMQTFVAALTEVEKARASQLTSAWKDFCTEVYERDDSLRPEHWTATIITPAFVYTSPVVPDTPDAPAPAPDNAVLTSHGIDPEGAGWRAL